MSTVVWGIQIVLAVVMLLSGMAKTFWSQTRLLQSGQSGMTDLRLPTIRFIGLSELLGAAGLTVPWRSGVWPWLTPLAALGFAVIMVLAYRTHDGLMRRATIPEVARRESLNRVTNVVLLLASVAVVVVRGWELLAPG